MDLTDEQLGESLRSIDAHQAFDPAATTAAVFAKLRRRRRRRTAAGAMAATVALVAAWMLTSTSSAPVESTMPNTAIAEADPRHDPVQLQQEIEQLQEQLQLAERLVRLAAANLQNEQLVAQMHNDLYAASRMQALQQLAAR